MFIACLFKGSQEQSFFLQTLLFTAFLATVLKILTYAFVSTWSLVSSAWEHVKQKMHPCHYPSPFFFKYSQIWYLQIDGCFSDWAPSFLHFWSSWLGQPLTRCRWSWINMILLLASLRFSKPFIFSRFQCSSWEALPSPADFSPCSSSLRPWVLGCLRLVHLSSLSHERKKSSWKWYF